jgi:hypothetical protein
MQVSGSWHTCDDGAVRPVLQGKVADGSGGWQSVQFLVDTGADHTVFCADDLEAVALRSTETSYQLAGVGGTSRTVVVETEIHFPQVEGADLVFRGQFAALTEHESLDMSVLGRDLTGFFALIIDRPGDAVWMIGQRHSYRIERR